MTYLVYSSDVFKETALQKLDGGDEKATKQYNSLFSVLLH